MRKMRICSALLLALALTACDSRPASQPKEAAPQAQNVTVASVESAQVRSTVPLPAQIAPWEIVDVYPKVTGFIESIRVDRGSKVRAGEVIAHLSAPELVAQRSQAEAALQAAQAQLTAAQAKLASDQGTYQHLATAAKTPGVVAQNDVAIAEQTAAADRAHVEAASNNVQSARDALRAVSVLQGYLDVRAPFDGVVTQRNLHPGALVGPSSGGAGAQAIVQVENLNRLRLVVPVPEIYAGNIKEGAKVPFGIPEYPGQKFTAPVARISHNVSQSTRTMAVELDVPNQDAKITPGSFATVEWPVQRAYATMSVPASAITTDLQRTFVIRVRGGKTEWVDVKTGLSANGKTEVFGDLQPGDKVVINATDAVRPGTAVTAQGS
jgi:membrane fusion protein, multidrug efflux system